MLATIPHADFTDPLLEARKQRRAAIFKATMTKPSVLVGLVALGALAFIRPYLVPAAWLIAIVAAFVFADRRAKAEWWPLLLTYLGLGPDLVDEPEPLSPLLRSGDERKVLRAGRDATRQLMVFRSTDVRRDPQGKEDRSHHDYTVVVMRSPTPSIRFLSAHEHRVSALKFLGDDLRGKTMRDVEEFKLESVEIGERFTLRSSTEDATRARQIFKPSFMVWFARSGVPFEYEGGDLVVFVDRVLEHAEEFKLLLSRAAEINAAVRGDAA